MMATGFSGFRAVLDSAGIRLSSTSGRDWSMSMRPESYGRIRFTSLDDVHRVPTGPTWNTATLDSRSGPGQVLTVWSRASTFIAGHPLWEMFR